MIRLRMKRDERKMDHRTLEEIRKMAVERVREGEKLEQRVTAQLTEIGNNPMLVRSFFKHPSVAYISDL